LAAAGARQHQGENDGAIVTLNIVVRDASIHAAEETITHIRGWCGTSDEEPGRALDDSTPGGSTGLVEDNLLVHLVDGMGETVLNLL